MINHEKNNPYVKFGTLIDVISWRGNNQAQKLAYRFLTDSDSEQCLSYADLDQKARKIGGYLQSIKSPGERILLFFQPGLDYIAAFFGCLYGGMIAVPSYPPKINSQDLRMSTIIKDAGATVVLSTGGILSKLGRTIDRQPALKELQWVDSSNIPEYFSEKWKDPGMKREDTAYLQYTSGSTAQPKGVIVSHGNIMHNSEMIYRAFGHSDDSCAVDWLPPYHDMGLIGGIIQPAYGGFPAVLMSPFKFLENPLAWLKAISKYNGTSCGGPNFAYELCMQKIPEGLREGLDLSGWDVAFNGAEPVRADTIEKFSREFAPYGFRKEAFYPCYGLAEATLLVTNCSKSAIPTVISVDEHELSQNRIETDDSGRGKKLVSSGKPFQGGKLLIVAPETGLPCEENQVGEIWVQSESVSKGYWKLPAESAKTFGAVPEGSGEGAFLRTGDLGFILNEELYVSGRLKDLIIIRGKNHYPQDIELTVERSHEAFQPGGGAVFSVELNGEERLVAVQELKRTCRNPDVEAIAAAVREAVAESHEIQVYALVLIRVMSLPKTSSGKVQRQLCKKKYLAGELMVTGESILDAPAGTTGNTTGNTVEKESQTSEESTQAEDFIISALKLVTQSEDRKKLTMLYLRKKAAEILKVKESQINESQPLTCLGLDSLMAVDLIHSLENSFGVLIPLSQLLEGFSLSDIAERLLENLSAVKNERASHGMTDRLEAFIKGQPMPLSHGQQALWFIHQLSKESAAYNLAYAVHLQEAIQPELLGRTLESIVRRHPILRTAFQSTDTGLAQICMPEPGFLLEQRSCAQLPEDELVSELESLSALPFDLEKGPLFKNYLFQDSDGEFTLLMVIHHIIADFWSLSKMLKELGSIYGSLERGRPVELAPPHSSYFDYIQRQAGLLSDNPGLEAYWKENLSGELQALNLAADYRRPAVQTYNGATRSRLLSRELFDRIKALGGENGTTSYMTCLAVFSVLLNRYTGQEDICIGTPTAGRSSTAFSDSIGYFVNPVVLRVLMQGNPSFHQLLAKVKGLALCAFEHQDYPFELLVDKLQIKRDLSRSPIFQVMFAYQKAPDPDMPQLSAFAYNQQKVEMQVSGLRLELIPLRNQSAQFDLSLTAAELETGLGLSVQYNRDIFKPGTIDRMLENFEYLFRDILENPYKQLSELSLLSPAQSQVVLSDWNNTDAAYPKASVHGLFEAQAEACGNTRAVICGSSVLTYRQLNERANRLANYIRHLKANEPGMIAVFLDRSADLVVTLLGILKSGGCYLPLDPVYPRERIAFILGDAGKQGHAPLVITEKKLLPNLPDNSGKVICIDRDWDEIWLFSPDNPGVGEDPEALAYVIYTSGSTGNPKGVMIPHRAVVNFLNSMRKLPGMKPEDILLSVTTVSFDIAGLEIFLPLTTGAGVVLAGFEDTISGTRLAEELDKNEITIIQATPSLYRLLLEAGWQGSRRLKLLCGGEAFPRDLSAKLVKRAREVWNMYGPTETTIWSTIHRVECEEDALYIGRPIDNTQVYILDGHLKPVPAGVIGELYIGGDGVAHGYFQNPELTRERFLPDPFRPGENSRIYKTGDLCRYLENGLIEFQGRVDHQIKLHGHRIELGEIEAVLSRHPRVKDALVVLQEEAAQGKRLVAYIVAGTMQGEEASALEPVSVSEMRGFLKEKLPEYMLPSYYMFIDSLPKTPNGKIDRKSLPKPDNTRPELETRFEIPQNDLERLVADIWKDKLKLDRIGINDNFFDLGGHSVLLAQIYQELNRVLPHKELSIVDLFQYPTVHSLAQYLNQSKAEPESELQQEERSNIRRNRRNTLRDDRELRRKARFEN